MLTCCNNSTFPVNSIVCKYEKIPSKAFNLFNIANNNINSTFKLKRKLD